MATNNSEDHLDELLDAMSSVEDNEENEDSTSDSEKAANLLRLNQQTMEVTMTVIKNML